MAIMDDPRVTLFFDTTHPLKSVDEPEVAIDSMYEPIYLPDGRGVISSPVDPGTQALERLGPAPQQVPFPVVPTTSMPPIQYGQRLPAPGLPTGASPIVPSVAQPMVQALQAPRYVSEFPIQGPVQLPSYPAAAAPQGVSTSSPGISPARPVTMQAPAEIMPWDEAYGVPGFSTQNPTEWYQDVPSAPGAPVTRSVNAPSSGPDTRYVVMQMDNGSIAYVPSSSVQVNAPSTGPDNRYTPALAPDGTTVMVATGFALPAGVTAIPGVTNLFPPVSARVNAPSTGEDNRYTPAQAADGSTVMVPTGYPLPTGVTEIPGVTNVDINGVAQGNLKNDVVLTPVVAPVASGFPGWVLPVVGAGIVLFLLFGKRKKEEVK